MIYIDYEAVMGLARVAQLVEPLRRAFLGGSITPGRHHHELDTDGNRTLLLMPAWRAQAALGIKISTVFNDNPSRGMPAIAGLYVLMSAENGSLSAIIDARAMTLLRTAAVSTLAADLMAPANAASFLMVGTGALAAFLVEGHVSVRRYRRIAVWGRNIAKAGEVVRRLHAAGINAHAVDDLESAARSADVISCATNAKASLVRGAWLKERAHLDLVGSYKPCMREADDDGVCNAAVVVDTVDALAESGDLVGPIERKVLDAARIDTLRVALRKGSRSTAQRTVFKSVGTGLADLAAAEYLFAQYCKNNVARSSAREA